MGRYNTTYHNPTDEMIEARFWQKVKKTETCWLWIPNTNQIYGIITVRGKKVYAHIFSYQLHYDNYDPKLDVCHECNTKSCVHPLHLYQATHSENLRHASRDELTTNISNELVKAIRDNQENLSQNQLANKYSVSQSWISNILNFKTRLDI